MTVGAGLTSAAESQTGMLIGIIAAAGGALVVCTICLFVYYRRKAKSKHRARTGHSTNSTKSPTKGATELSRIESPTKEPIKVNVKLIPMSEIELGEQLGTGAFGIVYKCTFPTVHLPRLPKLAGHQLQPNRHD